MKSSNAYAHIQFSNSICYIIYGTIDPLCTQKRSMYEYKHYLHLIARVLLYMHKSIPYPLFPPITNTIKYSWALLTSRLGNTYYMSVEKIAALTIYLLFKYSIT